MPKLEVKQIQSELEQGKVRTFYWLYGEERMKSRELYRRILLALEKAHQKSKPAPASRGARDLGMSPSESLPDGASGGVVEQFLFEPGVHGDAEAVVDEFHSMSLLSPIRLIRIRDAHQIKCPELIVQAVPMELKDAKEIQCVVVGVAKDLDARKKSSKILIEKAAVVACESVAESERDAWIRYLATRKGVELAPRLTEQLRLLEPWSLDLVDQELEKLLVASFLSPHRERGEKSDTGDGIGRKEDRDGSRALDLTDVTLQGVMMGHAGTEAFLDAFFTRKLDQALSRMEPLILEIQDALPLLGLLSWNLRQMIVLKNAQRGAAPPVKLNSFVMSRLNRWLGYWNPSELNDLGHDLYELDWQMKQVTTWNPGAWSLCVQRYCYPPARRLES